MDPDRLRLEGRSVVVLGAGAEMGPLRALLRWGADVVAVDLPRPAIWHRVVPIAAASGGRLTVPVAREVTAGSSLSADAGADLLHDLPRGRRLAVGGSTATSCSATTSTPTAPPTCGSPWPSTRSPCELLRRPPGRGPRLPRHAHRRLRRATPRRRPRHARVCRRGCPRAPHPAGRARPQRRAPARVATTPPDAEPGDQRQPRAAAGPELRSRETAAAVAGDGGAARRRRRCRSTSRPRPAPARC